MTTLTQITFDRSVLGLGNLAQGKTTTKSPIINVWVTSTIKIKKQAEFELLDS